MRISYLSVLTRIKFVAGVAATAVLLVAVVATVGTSPLAFASIEGTSPAVTAVGMVVADTLTLGLFT